jgi:protein-S-isoprenylcysteine O-methyltransferase Ste14
MPRSNESSVLSIAPGVLSVPQVQIIAVVSLAGALAAFVSGRRRPARSKDPIRVVARNPPARGTQAVWIGGTLVTVFWPIGMWLAPEYAYHWPPTPDFAGSWVVQLLGIGIAASAGTLYARAAYTLGHQMTPAIQVRQDHLLLQSGPYRYIRHPVYTAIVLGALGQTLLFLSPLLAFLTLVLAGLAEYRARLEEELLASPGAFGATYRAYIARTGRFLPRLRRRA